MKSGLNTAVVAALLIFTYYAAAVTQTNQINALSRNDTSIEDRIALNGDLRSEQQQQQQQQEQQQSPSSHVSSLLEQRENLAESSNNGGIQPTEEPQSNYEQNTIDDVTSESNTGANDQAPDQNTESQTNINDKTKPHTNVNQVSESDTITSNNDASISTMQQRLTQPEDNNRVSPQQASAEPNRNDRTGDTAERNTRNSEDENAFVEGITKTVEKLDEGLELSDHIVDELANAVFDNELEHSTDPLLRKLGKAEIFSAIGVLHQQAENAQTIIKVSDNLRTVDLSCPTCTPPPPPPPEEAKCDPHVAGDCGSLQEAPCQPAEVLHATCTSGELTCEQSSLKYLVTCSAEFPDGGSTTITYHTPPGGLPFYNKPHIVEQDCVANPNPPPKATCTTIDNLAT